MQISINALGQVTKSMVVISATNSRGLIGSPRLVNNEKNLPQTGLFFCNTVAQRGDIA